MSVPTIFGIVNGYTSTITSPKNVPLPTDVSPTTNPNTAPIATARILSRRLRMNGRSLDLIPRLMKVFARKPSPPMTSAAPTAYPSIVVALDQLGNADARERQRPGAEEHPQRQPRVDGAEPAMPDRAEALEDRAVEDVRAHGVRRLEAEEDHEDRRHQRAAAHAGEADDRTDQQPSKRELPGHLLT
jgi:hypothetical protein